MHGNAWEWCHNLSKPSDLPEVFIDSNQGRLLRGGSFNYSAVQIRSTTRTYNRPTFPNYNIGFRPARTYNVSP